MTNPNSLDDRERADLVAYLDGELDEKSARLLETKLSLNPDARAEAEALRRAWDMLDYLPKAAISPNFTHRTLDRVEAVKPGAVAAAPKPWLRWGLGLGWAAAVLLAALVGYAAVALLARRAPPPPPPGQAEEVDPHLVRDARLLENLHHHGQADDAGFLRELDDPDLFGDDRDLHGPDGAANARLTRVLERYTTWLDHLPVEKQNKIEQAATARERLQLIRAYREQEWLPRKTWEELRNKPALERVAAIKRLRQQQRERRADWQVVYRNWDDLMPRAVQDPPHRRPLLMKETTFPLVRTFTQEYLKPLLSKEEEDRLKQSVGQWPLFQRTVVELADAHPFLLPGPSEGPTRFEELPAEVQKRIENGDPKWKDRLRAAEGSWPAYAIAVAEVTRLKDPTLASKLGPTHPKDSGLRHFKDSPAGRMLKKMGKPLNPEEKERLKKAEGQWPEYPRTLYELAHKHRLRVPPDAGARVLPPGRAGYWDRYRLKSSVSEEPLADVPRATLMEFALIDLSPRDRAVNHISFADPLAWDRLRRLYTKRHREGKDKTPPAAPHK